MESIASSSILFLPNSLHPSRSPARCSSFQTSISSSSFKTYFRTSRSLVKLRLPDSRGRRFPVTCAAASGGGSLVTEISESQFSDKVLNSDRPVLVEFVASWCGPCRLISTILESVAKDYKDRLTVVKVDCDMSPELVKEYEVYGLPTLILFKDGQEVPGSKREGAITKKKLIEYLDPLLGSASVV